MTNSPMTPEDASRLSLAEQHEWFRRATSRRAVLRGGAAVPPSSPKPLATAARPHGAVIPVFGRHIMYGSDPATQMSVAWQVAAPVGRPFLRVGESPTDLSHRIDADIRTVTTPRGATKPLDSVPPSASATIEQYYVHASASGLRPGRTYYYSVGHQGLDPARLVASGTFTTARRDREPFTFTAFGDQGVSYDAAATSTQVRAQNPAFHLHAGDVAYAEDRGLGLITDGYDPRVWDSFFIEIESAAGHIPWQVAVGNHEMEAWYSPDGYGGQHARFDFPGAPAAATPPTYYSFAYGNVGIVSLDANDVSYEIPANNGYTGGAQTSWLASTLRTLRADPGIDFIVAYFHHCGYTTCAAHGSEGGVRERWAPLFDQYSVDLVINGHNHIYERTDPIKGGSPTAPAPIGATVHAAQAGTTYIVAGAAGDSLYAFPAPDSYAGHIDDVASVAAVVNESGGTEVTETVTWSRVRYTGYCLLVIDSQPSPAPGQPSRLRVRSLDEVGTEIDEVTLVS